MKHSMSGVMVAIALIGCAGEPEPVDSSDSRACYPDGVMLDGQVCVEGAWRMSDLLDMPVAFDMVASDQAPSPDMDTVRDMSTGGQMDLAREDSAPDMRAPADMPSDMPVDMAPEQIPDCTQSASDAAALEVLLSQELAPGEVVCLEDGLWTDLDVLISAQGRQDAPVVVRARNPGAVVIGGRSGLRMAGRFVWVHGLVFDGGQSARSSLIAFRKDSDELCEDCRVSDVTIRRVDEGRDENIKWVSLHGERNRVDHCWFEHKSNEGALLVVWRAPGAPADRHQIDHNYFYDRPPLGKNGAEAIRVGTSDTHMTDSFTVVEHNLFEQMNGEIEIISNKSGGNRYLFNTFLRSEGMLTMRHGKNGHIEGNIFLTGGVEAAAGIRLIDSGHVVINNYVEGVRTSSSFRGGIVLVGGQPDATINGYQPVEDVIVAFNTIVDSDQSLVFGGGDSDLTIRPRRVVIAHNLVARGRGEVVREIHGLESPMFVGNQLEAQGGLGVRAAPGLELVTSSLEARQGLWRPTAQSMTRDAVTQAPAYITHDIDGQARQLPFDVGADEDVARGGERAPLAADDVGPRDYRP